MASLAMPPRTVDRKAALAVDPRHWRRLAPGLSIEGQAARGIRARAVNVRQAGADLATHGYVHLGEVIESGVLRRMVYGVERLRADDWPAVFAFLYDEFWLLPRSGKTPAFLRTVLGDRCEQSPNVWLHYVEARKDAAGWPPHRDHSDPDRLTLWIPLTPAAVEDGCISVLPRHLLPRHLAGSWARIDAIAREDVLRLLHAARPLPAAAGSLVAWHTGVLHWGGHRTNATRPRIACSMEFARGPIDGRELGMPGLPLAGRLPSFADRVRLVANMVLLYYPNEPRVARYVALARRLVGE